MLREMLENVRQTNPLIHNITNYVTVNDCANILLACGGSPIMADDVDEAEEITSICGGLNINIGTLNQRTIPAMHKAGKKANELGHPVMLDPVGAGASILRTRTAVELMENVQFAVIRGNISEIKTLAREYKGGAEVQIAENKCENETYVRERTSESDEMKKVNAGNSGKQGDDFAGGGTTRGVDADIADAVTKENLPQAIAFAKAFAKRTNAVIAITGAIDIVADGEKAFCIYNGHPMMSSITGTGCQLSAMTAAYVTANQSTPLEAVAAAVCVMGVCGEKAYARLTEQDGNSTYRIYIIDAVYRLTGEELERCAKYEIY